MRGKEALVHELATRFLATLQVLAREGRLPLASRATRAVDAELEELSTRVVLDVVVIHLHELEHVAVLKAGIAKRLAVLLILKPDEPDALARGPTVLLDHARLERGALLEAALELILGVVRKGVHQATPHVCDLAQSVLGAHLGLHIGGGPYERTLVHLVSHEGVELGLGAGWGAL